VSHIVSGLTHTYKTTEPSAHSTAEKLSVRALVNSPLAVGRQAVRFILASMRCSTTQLNAAAAPATSQIPKHAMAARCTSAQLGSPGTASTMPISAQNTISWITLGLVSAWYWRQTDGKADGAAGLEAELIGWNAKG